MKNIFSAVLIALVVSACSGTKVIERTTYIESKSLPDLKLPEDMDFVELDPIYPIPEVKGSIEGLTPEQLEELKKVPDLIEAPTKP